MSARDDVRATPDGGGSPRRFRERRRLFALTREGRVFVLVTVGVGIAAVNTGNNLFYLVLGLLLSMLLTSGVLSDLVLHGLRVKRLAAPRLFARSPACFELEVTNTKRRLASLSFELLDVAHGETDPPAAYVLKLPAGATTAVLVSRTATARGTLALEEIRVRTRYPFGIVEKTRRFVVESTVVVYPELVDVALPSSGDDSRGVDVVATRRGEGAEVLGLREYREGEPARSIHWRKSATFGRPIAREHVVDVEPEVVVGLDACDDNASSERLSRFEHDVSRAASLVVAAIARGRSVVVERDGAPLARGAAPSDLDRVLSALALLPPHAASVEKARDVR